MTNVVAKLNQLNTDTFISRIKDKAVAIQASGSQTEDVLELVEAVQEQIIQLEVLRFEQWEQLSAMAPEGVSVEEALVSSNKMLFAFQTSLRIKSNLNYTKQALEILKANFVLV
jgi:hypothetical protein